MELPAGSICIFLLSSQPFCPPCILFCLQTNPLEDMEKEGLLSQVAKGTLPLMVVCSDHVHHGITKFLSSEWESNETKEARQEAACMAQLAARLSKLNPESGKQMAEKVPIVTVRALEFEGIMEAWSSLQLTNYSQEQLQTLLLRTGAARLYCSMMRIFK